MKTGILSLLLLVNICLYAQVREYHNGILNICSSQSVIVEKNFFLFSELDQNDKVNEVLQSDKKLNKLLNEKLELIASALTTPKRNITDMVKPYQWSKKEIDMVSEELKTLLRKESVLVDFVNNDLKPSKAYINYQSLTDDEYLVSSWRLCAKAMNHIIDVYASGKKPRYPRIDSISYDVKSNFFKNSIYFWSDALKSHSKWETEPFYKPALDLCISLLYLNHRDEAARYEPMEIKENAKVVNNIPNIDFNQFPYAAIVVLGSGPENYRDHMTSVGKLNLMLGYLEYKAGNAPLIIVSGGHAHPYRTQFAEAIEMKKELMNRYGVPEANIIIEPHARHTTTNLRNSVRLIEKYHVPMDKKCMAVSNNDHIQYVTDKVFKERCLNELGYMPVTLGKRLSQTAVEFTPSILSNQQNPMEPLDP